MFALHSAGIANRTRKSAFFEVTLQRIRISMNRKKRVLHRESDVGSIWIECEGSWQLIEMSRRQHEC